MKSMLMAIMAVAVAVTFSAPSFAGEGKDKKDEKKGGHVLVYGEEKKKDDDQSRRFFFWGGGQQEEKEENPHEGFRVTADVERRVDRLGRRAAARRERDGESHERERASPHAASRTEPRAAA